MKTRFEAVLQWIEWYLDANQLAVGDAFPHEREIVAATGLGRSSVREAVTALKALGIVVSRRKGGMRLVRDPSLLRLRKYFGEGYDEQRLLQAMEFRSAMELGLAGLIVAHISKDDHRFLNDLITRVEAEAHSHADLNTAEIEFHTRLLRASGNEVALLMAGMFAPVFTSIHIAGRFSKKTVAIWTEQHRELLSALRSGDAEQFYQGMSKHVRGYMRLHGARPAHTYAVQPKT